MVNGWKYLSLVTVGILIGACAKQVLIPDAHAQGGHPKYMVVGQSAFASGYEEDLNKYAAEGWRFAGAIANGQGSHLILVKE